MQLSHLGVRRKETKGAAACDLQNPADFLPLNAVILKACQPAPADRYLTAAEMRVALAALLNPPG